MIATCKSTKIKKHAPARVLARCTPAALGDVARRRRRLVLQPVKRDPFLEMMSSRRTTRQRPSKKSHSHERSGIQAGPYKSQVKALVEQTTCTGCGRPAPPDLVNVGGGMMANMLLAQRLPEKLQHPELGEPSPEALAKAGYDPEHVSRDLEFVRRELARNSEVLYSAIANTNQEVPHTGYGCQLPSFATVRTPKKMEVEHMPSHMLAVYSSDPEVKVKRVVALPVHAPLLAAHCCRVPPLPTPTPPSPSLVPSAIESHFHRQVIPLVPFAIPSTQTFPLLLHFLYTQDIPQLFRTLLPVCPSSGGMWDGDFSRLPEVLAEMFTGSSLVSGAMRVYGVWQNACSLGVLNPRIWQVIDIAWKAHHEALLLCRR